MADRLTTPERMMGLITGGDIDRVPVNIMGGMYAAAVNGISLGEMLESPQLNFDSQIWMNSLFEDDSGPGYDFPGWVHYDFGGKLEFPKVPQLAFPTIRDEDRLIKTEKDIYTLELPAPGKGPAMQKYIEFGHICRKHGMGVTVKGGSFTELMAHLMGPDILLKWLIKKPEAMHVLYRKILDYTLDNVKVFIDEFGVENVSLFNTYQLDSHDVMNPKVFEEMSLPYIIELHEKVLDMGVKGWIVHLCGNHTKNLHFWKEDIPLAPRTVFTVGYEMDMKKTAKELGPDHIIAGNIKNHLIQFGSADEVYVEAGRIITEMKDSPGGFIFMPDCSLTLYAPPVNIHALVKAARDFGSYD